MQNVESRKLEFDILQCILLDVFDTELSNMSRLRITSSMETPTAAVKEYIERGEQDGCNRASASTVGPLSHFDPRRGAKVISFV